MVIAILLAVSLLALLAQDYRSDIATRIQNTYSSQTSQTTSGDSPNVITSAFSNISANTASFIDIVEAKILSGIMLSSTAIVRSEKAIVYGFYTLEGKIFSNVISASTGFIHLEDSIVHDFYISTVTIIKVERNCLVFPLRFADNSFFFSWNILDETYGSIHDLPSLKLPSLNSIVRPQDNYAVPVITQMKLKQAALIESGTTNVVLPSTSSGTGGACDSGSGNGGYPISWCNAPINSTSTIPYSGDPINRECTSYAYWYFTNVEGQIGLHVSGNAKYWASTSNYPTHITPAIGAIAIETTGAYGHVAVVQALPGQQYEGNTVPVGYVLVSEMNYDWQGHFRYSYSPLSKFSAYIYP